MTEVPEHLLKKAAEARARLTGEGAPDSGDSADTGQTSDAAPVPATAAAPTPAPVPEPEVPAVPEPDPPYVEAAKRRKTIPFWVMPVLLFLPIWAIYYVGYLENPPVVGGLAVEGAEVYAESCAGCHGAAGGGGSGRQLNQGEVTLTFPFAEDGYDGLAGQLEWVANGSTLTGELEGSSAYGDPDREGGPHEIGGTGANMAGFGDVLELEELVAVVFHERSQFGLLSAEEVEAEFETLEEFLHVREEAGDVELAGETTAEIAESLGEARATLSGGAAEE